MSPPNRAARPQHSNKPLFVVVLVIVALAVFAIQEWADASSRRSAGARRAARAEGATQESAALDMTPAPTWGAGNGSPPQPVPGALATAPHAVPPDPANRVSRARVEAAAKIESLRGYIDRSCWTRGDAAPGVKVTFNVTFDPAGREIARGISEDRRAPAGEFARCLRRLGGTRLAIPPPGANVGLSIPVSFP